MGRDSVFGQRACPSAAGRKTRFILGLLCLVFLYACGDDEGSPPVLTGYDVPWPPRFLVGFPDALLLGTVSFEDPDGDVVLLHAAWRDCGAGEAKKLDTLQEDLNGTKTGEILFRAMISANCPAGDYAIQLSVTDGQGHDSNVIPVPYEIYE